MKIQFKLIITLVLLIVCAPAHAISKEVVNKAKLAVAYIEVSDGSGSAFQIDPAGYFITNQHVVEDEKTVKLVLNSGEANQETVTGHVVRVDKDLDFALIKADKPASETLTFGQDSDLYETLPITAFGFPLGKDILLGADGSPTVSINTGHVSALRQDKGGIEMIQIDADVNPGNSGGPVLDDQGHVLGVVEAGIEGATGLNFAIPVGILKSFLYKPDVSVTPASVPESRESEVTKFTVDVTSFNSAFKPKSVDVTLQVPSLPDRTFIAVQDTGSRFSFSAQLVPKSAGPKQLQLDIKNGGGSVGAVAADIPIKIGGKSYNLSDFTEIFPSGSSASELTSGGSLSGRVNGLPTIDATISGIRARIDLSSVDCIQVASLDQPVDSVHYKIRITSESSGPIVVEGDLSVGSAGQSSHGLPPELSARSVSSGNAPTPIDVTGYNANVVTSRHGTPTDAADNDVNSWFESGAVDDSGNQHNDGLVAGSLVSSCDNSVTGGHTVFWIQPFDRPNALRLGNGLDNNGTFVLRQSKKYRVLSVLACAYSAGHDSTGTLTLDFADGSQSAPIQYNTFDWCTGQSNEAVADLGRNEGVRHGSGFIYVNDPSASLFETDINLQKLNLTGKPIKSITFQGTGDGLSHHSSTNIFAVSGVPE